MDHAFKCHQAKPATSMDIGFFRLLTAVMAEQNNKTDSMSPSNVWDFYLLKKAGASNLTKRISLGAAIQTSFR